MELLGEKLAPLLRQFLYINQQVMPSSAEFFSGLDSFLECLPKYHGYAVEVRNGKWIGEPLVNLLHSHNIVLALVDQVWLPPITELAKRLDVLTTDFTYIRWIGDRKGVEKKTKIWGKIIVDRERDTKTWVDYIRQFLYHGRTVYAYYNNHWAGFAPGSIQLFSRVWNEEQ